MSMTSLVRSLARKFCVAARTPMSDDRSNNDSQNTVNGIVGLLLERLNDASKRKGSQSVIRLDNGSLDVDDCIISILPPRPRPGLVVEDRV